MGEVVRVYTSSRENNPDYALHKQMVNYQAVDVNSIAYDDFTYTNRLNFYPFYMVGYTFMGWSSDTSWTNVDDSQVALFNNCKSFLSSASNSVTYDTVGEYNFYNILKDQILLKDKVIINSKSLKL